MDYPENSPLLSSSHIKGHECFETLLECLSSDSMGIFTFSVRTLGPSGRPETQPLAAGRTEASSSICQGFPLCRVANLRRACARRQLAAFLWDVEKDSALPRHAFWELLIQEVLWKSRRGGRRNPDPYPVPGSAYSLSLANPLSVHSTHVCRVVCTLFGVKESQCFADDFHAADQLKKENKSSVIRDFLFCRNHSVREEIWKLPDV